MTTHGTPGAYNAGCRCDECREQHRLRMRVIRARLHARPLSEVPHGTPGGYYNWGCRCARCIEAQAARHRDWRRRARARSAS